MSKINFSATACCLNSLSDCVAAINNDWKIRWNMECPGLFFRGSDKVAYDLNPSILRDPYPETPKELAKFENQLYVEFRLRSQPLFGRRINNGWEAMLTMQQYGLPTRLLDWSSSLSVAAYFSIRDIDAEEDGCIWVMASRYLMELRGVEASWRTVVGDPSIEVLSLRQSDEGLSEFMKNTPVPLRPDQIVTRMIAQRGIYTLHSFEKDSLETIAVEDRNKYGDACFLHKIKIPFQIKEGLRQELSVISGISEESIFPDIEGFARDFVMEQKRVKRRGKITP